MSGALAWVYRCYSKLRRYVASSPSKSPEQTKVPEEYLSLIDSEWYLARNADVKNHELDPRYHYQAFGWKEGRKPNAFFDSQWYLREYSQWVPHDVDPLMHYCTIGWRNGFDPSPEFSVSGYLECNPDVHDAGIEPLLHFLHYGLLEGREPVPRAVSVTPQDPNESLRVDTVPSAALNAFDAEYYGYVNPDLAEMPPEQLKEHFRTKGYFQGRLYAAPSKARVRVVAAMEPQKQKTSKVQFCGGRPQYSSPLVISGFHRSGTSMIANLFMNAGLFLGDELLGANESNPYGHFEAKAVVDFHDRLLKASGTNWQTDSDFMPVMKKSDWTWMLNYGIRNSTYPAWGFKDPRNCLFLSQWAEVFPGMRVLYVFRPAVECVHSIKRRAARDLVQNRSIKINQRFWLIDDLALYMYLIYASAFLRFAESFNGDICVVNLDDIIEGRDIISEVRENWQYPLVDSFIDETYDSSVMTRAGPNEIIKNISLLRQIEEVETKLRAMTRRGFTRGGVSLAGMEASHT